MKHVEPSRLDRERLETLVVLHGEDAAERLVGRALESIAINLNAAERAWKAGEVAPLPGIAEELAETAGGIGLETLARVARDVAQVARIDDPAALGAVLARLIRLGETSLLAAWNLDGQSL